MFSFARMFFGLTFITLHIYSVQISVEEILLSRHETGCNFSVYEYLKERPGISELSFCALDSSLNEAEKKYLLSQLVFLPSIKTVHLTHASKECIKAIGENPHIEHLICETIDLRLLEHLPGTFTLTIQSKVGDDVLLTSAIERILSCHIDASALSHKGGHALVNARQLQNISLTGCVSIDVLSILSQLPQLRQLSFNNGILTSDMLELMSSMERVTWSFFHCVLHDIEALTSLSHIQSIALSPTQVTDAMFRTIYMLPHLEALSITFPKDLENDPFPLLSLLSNLRVLSLNAVPKGYEQSLNSLKDLSKLRALYLDGHADARELSFISELKQLESLTLSRCILSDGAPFLCDLRNLRSLELHECSVDDTSCKDIAKVRQLRTLHLDAKEYSNKGIGYIAGLNHLEVLSIANTYVTSQGVRHIAQINSLKSIALFGVQFTPKDLEKILSASGIRWFGTTENVSWMQDVIRHFYKEYVHGYDTQKNGMFSAFCHGDSLLDGFCSDIDGLPIRKLFALKKYLSKADLQEVNERYQKLLQEGNPPSHVRLSMYYYALLEKAVQYPLCRKLMSPPQNPFLQE